MHQFSISFNLQNPVIYGSFISYKIASPLDYDHILKENCPENNNRLTFLMKE